MLIDVRCGQQASSAIERREKGLPDAPIRVIADVQVTVTRSAPAIDRILEAVRQRTSSLWGFCNAHTVTTARSNPTFRAALKQFTLFNDGVAIDIASKLLFGCMFPENLNGTDFIPALLRSLPKGTPIFLYGSKPGVAALAARKIEETYGIKVVGSEHGFVTPEEEITLVDRIRLSDARLVLIGMGHPRQEVWAARASPHLCLPLICVGAFLDFTAGVMPRAPKLMRRMRVEWVYRLIREPRRLSGRYLWHGMSFLTHALFDRRAGRHEP